MALTRLLGSSRFLAGLVSLLLLCAVLPQRALADVINFEGAPLGPLVQTSNTTFSNATVRDYWPGFAHSGTKAIEACFAQEFCTRPLRIDFSAGQQRVKLWVGFSAQLSAATTVILRAHEQYGSQVGNAQVVLNPSAGPIPAQASLEIVTTSPNIRYVTVFVRGPNSPSVNNGLVVDDVEFDTTGAPPPCTAALPTVSLSQPVDGTVVSTNQFRLQGIVTTNAPLLEATLGAKPSGTPGEGTVANILGAVISPSGGPFATNYGGAALIPGENTVAVTVRNCRGAVRVLRDVVFTPIASGARFKFLGLEVVQATQDMQGSVPLIAGKPTIVRVYLAVEGTASIANVTGALTATRPGAGGVSSTLNSANDATINSSPLQAKRLDANASLNFVLPDAWIRAGTAHFQLSKLYIQGSQSTLPCIGCTNPDANAPYWLQFQLTKPLKVVLAPYAYTRSNTTPDILFAPMLTLQFVNNVFPLSGDFPSDAAGIKVVRILPMRSTDRNLATFDAAGDFQDELEDLASDVLDQYGSDVRLFGMTPCFPCAGAAGSGRVAYGDSWAMENGIIPLEKVPDYGEHWAHEFGHTFGRAHLSNDHNEVAGGDVDLGSPYAHGGIGEPGVAISTMQWLGSPHLIPPYPPDGTHAHDFMSYGRSPRWVSPYTYKALFSKLRVTQAFALAPPAPVEKLVVGGRIAADGRTTLRPFHRVTTRSSTSVGARGAFSVELFDVAGRVTLTHRFDAQKVEHSPQRTLSFTEFVPWRAGTQKIVVKRGGTVLASRAVSLNTPRLQITSPVGGDAWGAKAVVRWQAADDDGDRLTFAVLYNAGRDQSWIPIANGVTANEVTIDTSLLPGSNAARIRVRATDGVNTTIAESRPFNVADKPPLTGILNPRGEKPVARGTPIDLTGFAYDPEDGVLSGDRLTWTSDRERLIGRGGRLKTRLRSLGRHVITLTATDSRGRSVTSHTFVRVER